jgi:hypothetical protein
VVVGFSVVGARVVGVAVVGVAVVGDVVGNVVVRPRLVIIVSFCLSSIVDDTGTVLLLVLVVSSTSAVG